MTILSLNKTRHLMGAFCAHFLLRVVCPSAFLLYFKFQFIVLCAGAVAPLPLPLGEVAEHREAGEGFFVPSQSKIYDFCQLSHRESQGQLRCHL